MKTLRWMGVLVCLSLSACGAAVEEDDGDEGEETAEQASAVEAGVPIKSCPGATGKALVMTFDDGPSPNSDRLLDLLRQKGVRATFFVKGRRLASTSSGYLNYRRMVRRMYDEGHDICSHTLTHARLTSVSDATIRYEMNTTEDLLAGVTGRRTRCMRPPYSAYDSRVLGVLRSLNYKVILQNIDAQDWQYATTEQPDLFNPQRVFDIIQRGVAGYTSPRILTQHDASTTLASIELVPSIVDYVRSQGWRTITLAQCLGEPIDVPL